MSFFYLLFYLRFLSNKAQINNNILKQLFILWGLSPN